MIQFFLQLLFSPLFLLFNSINRYSQTQGNFLIAQSFQAQINHFSILLRKFIYSLLQTNKNFFL